ncbi:MAG: hypothetical protein K5987_07065 [Lachnospiraceae bacterium]|nr:hypothetical protein [Lachnospiraceae bacterium]
MNHSDLYEMGKKYEARDDMEKAYRCYLEAALSEDDGEAMYELGNMHFEENRFKEGYNKAGRFFGFAYDRNAKIAPWTLIIAGDYWKEHAGEDEKGLVFAIKYYRAAAELGEEYGYACLGELYYKLGEYEKAYKNLLKVKQENQLVFYYMGRLCDEGHVVEKDRDKAVEYYKKAIECVSEIVDKYGDEYGMDDHCRMAEKRLKELGAE